MVRLEINEKQIKGYGKKKIPKNCAGFGFVYGVKDKQDWRFIFFRGPKTAKMI